LTLYVSTDGDDAAAGTARAPSGGDGPLRTLEGARDRIRAARAGGFQGSVDVRVLAGVHERVKPFVLEPRDSGFEGAPVRYVAEEPGTAVVSGGRPLTGFRAEPGGRFALTIPEVARGEWTFSQLYRGGARCPRPRLPRQGFYTVEEELPPSEAAAGRGHDRFRFKEGDVKHAYHASGDVDVLAYHIWCMSRMRIARIDTASRTLTFTGPTSALTPWHAFQKGNRYVLENVREALGSTDEWYLDRATGLLTYVPPPELAADPAALTLTAPRSESLLELRGDPERGAYVEHVRFEGLAFRHTLWNTPAAGYSFPQAEVALGAALEARGARRCQFVGCTVSETGTWALRLGAGCQENVVEGCAFVNLGAGGVQIGTTALPAGDALAARGNVVRNCDIGPGGQVHPAAIGVWIGQADHNTIEHNDIHDLYYTGVSVGWTWGYGPSAAHDNLILDNHIARIGQGLLSDMGGVYTLGVSPGTRISGNLIHDVEAFGYGGWGLYTDEGSSGIELAGNAVYNTKSAGFHQHYGRDNVVKGNILAFGREAQVMRTRAEEHRSFTFEGNVIVWDEGPLLAGNFDGAGVSFDNNLYWNTKGAPVKFGRRSLEEWRALGQDLHSRIEDPHLGDPRQGNFDFDPRSPALPMGFAPRDWRKAGAPARPPGSFSPQPHR
jgi:hypothetical protein